MDVGADESNPHSPAPALNQVDRRPKTITAVAIFLFLAAGIAVIVGASLLFPNPLMDDLWKLNKPAEAVFREIGRLSGIPLLLLAGGTFAAARGLLRRKAWAWWFAVALFTVNGIGDVVSFAVTRDWFRSASGVVISSAFLWILFTRKWPFQGLRKHSPPG